MDIHIETWVFPALITVAAVLMAGYMAWDEGDPLFRAFGTILKLLVWALAAAVSLGSWLLWALLR